MVMLLLLIDCENELSKVTNQNDLIFTIIPCLVFLYFEVKEKWMVSNKRNGQGRWAKNGIIKKRDMEYFSYFEFPIFEKKPYK